MIGKQRDSFVPIPHGTNPRQLFEKHRERGRGRFRFTFDDVAKAAQQTTSTTRVRLRLSDTPRSIATYISSALAAKSEKLTDAALDDLFKDTRALWEARWPRFDLYRCGMPDCRALLFEAGLCGAHGGAKSPSIATHNSYFVLRVGSRYEPFHRFVVGTRQAIHLDKNRWNNRSENLKPISARFRRKQWTYGYRELGALFGVSEDGVRKATARKILDPSSLQSVCCFWASGMEGLSDLGKR